MRGRRRPIGVIRRELGGHAFACIPECGFCCTNPPEVPSGTLAALRSRVAPAPLNTTFNPESGRTHLALQGGCGACTLLKDLACTEYDLRPGHCRYFPFHVYFGAEPEVYVNYTCRGVVRQDGGDMTGAFTSSLLRHAPEGAMEAGDREARATFMEFEKRARAAGAWEDAAPVLEKARRQAAMLLTGRGVEALASRSGEPATSRDLLAEALASFEEEGLGARPYYLAPDYRWLTFGRTTGATIEVIHVTESGSHDVVKTIPEPDRFPELDAAERAAIAAYLRHLTSRTLLLGSAYDAVDAVDYDATVGEALAARLATVASDLAVRAWILRHLGTAPTPAILGDEVARFYDTEFLDMPTIGGFL